MKRNPWARGEPGRGRGRVEYAHSIAPNPNTATTTHDHALMIVLEAVRERTNVGIPIARLTFGESLRQNHPA
jgi:hypothetical protein